MVGDGQLHMGGDIRFSCRHYRGDRPCGRSPLCGRGCAAYEPTGKRILVIKLGAMGDVLRTTPILRGLRAHCDPCHITWLTDPASENLLVKNPLIDRIMTWRHSSTLMLQAEQFDLALNFEKEPQALALDELTRVKEKRGFALHPAGTLGIHNAASEYALRLGIDDELKFRLNRKSMPEILFEMAEIPYDGEEYVYDLSDYAGRFASDFSRLKNLNPSRPVVGLNTGCGSVFPTKQWSRENFMDLIQVLKAETNAQVLLLGGQRERNFNAAILENSDVDAVIDTGSQNTLEEFAGLIHLCDVLVSSDSLGMHLGIALRKNVVALFGPTSASEIDLYGRGEKVVTSFPCAPCYRKSCEMSPSCMRTISPQSVLEAVQRWLPRTKVGAVPPVG